ncbi:MAG TPA: AAA family ATPase [Candidatus Acidoferrales bacterium]|nr:AAA family ATPase [Candidatus Acidoferrales bacterium]
MLVRIALFGQPHVVASDGAREIALPRKTLNVLAYLILNSKRPTTRDSVAFTLFPDEDEEKARGRLRRNLSDLLASLPSTDGGEAYVHANAERVAWNAAAPAEVDVFAFERAIAEGRDDDALVEYAGPLLPTLYDEWTTASRERLREAANDALARIIARDRSLRRFDAATVAAHRLLEDDPWREDIVRQLIAIRYDAGDRAGALSEFERFSSLLRDEMQTEPMPETIALRDAVLRGARLATSEPRRTETAVAPVELSLPFVGRDDAMARAIERWHTSADGRAGALFVCGEAGIGKSRFSAELSRAIEREGGITIFGDTSAGGERRPYEAIIEALRNAPQMRSQNSWHDLIEQLLDEHLHATLSDDRSARVRLFGTIQKAILELARSRPLAVILEDLHWSGDETTALLDHLLDRITVGTVLFVVTYRDEEVARPHPLRALVQAVERAGRAERLTLTRLSVQDSLRAAQFAATSNVAPESIAGAVSWSEGLPLLLSEALRDLDAGRELTGGDLVTIFGERFARLSPEAETALSYAAVIGARFDLDTLAAATGWSDDIAVSALGPSIELGLVRAGARTRGLTFNFSHHLVHAAMLARIPVGEVPQIHALVARALKALVSGGERAVEIAQHYSACGERRLAAEYYALGARYALGVFANKDARDAASAGLAFVADDDREVRYSLVSTRERALARLGAERRADAALLCELAEGDESRLCDALERLTQATRGDKLAHEAALARMKTLADESTYAAACYESTVAREDLLEGSFQRAAAAAERAARHYSALADEESAFRAQLLRIEALIFLGEHDEGLALVAALRPQGEACESLSLQMQFYAAASSAAIGAIGETQWRDSERYIELALLIGDRYAEAHARHNVGWAALASGDLARAQTEYELSVAIQKEIGNVRLDGMTFFNLAAVYYDLGNFAEAHRLLDELDAMPDRSPWTVLQSEAHRAYVWMRAGELENAERVFHLAEEHARELSITRYSAYIQACLAEVHARQGKLTEARVEAVNAIAALSERNQTSGVAEAWALVARIEAELKDVRAARESIATADALASSLSEHSLGARIWWDLAAASALLGDVAQADAFAGKAARIFCEMSMTMDADTVEIYARLPWHIAPLAYLQRREVSLDLSA